MEAIKKTGLEEKIGVSNFYESIEEGVQAFLQRKDQTAGEKVGSVEAE